MTGVAIIGAGAIGLTCAWELRRRGIEVTVYERSHPGAGASWGNAGWIVPVFSAPVPAPGLVAAALRWMLLPKSPFHIRPSALPVLAPWLLQFASHCNARDYSRGLAAVATFAQKTMSLFDALARDGISAEMSASGLLFLFLTETGMEHVAAELAAMAPFGYRARRLAVTDLREIEPAASGRVIGGFLIEGERHLRPELFITSLVGRLVQLGVEIRTQHEVRDLNSLPADAVILAAGAWSAGIARRSGFHLPIQPGWGYGITLERPATTVRRPTYLAEGRVACTPFSDSLRLAGTMELSGLTSTANHQRFAAIRETTGLYLGGWPANGAETQWRGPRPLTPDGLPAIGQASKASNVFVATGHGMLGLTLAPVTAAALADLICSGRTSFDLAPFDPRRFS